MPDATEKNSAIAYQSGTKRVLVIGAGGVGGYFGGLLARAGHEVTLFARGAHLDAIRTRGLEVRTPEGAFVAPVLATDSASSLPEADLALLAVKSYSLPEVLPVVRTAAARGATVLPLLNGVTIFDELHAGGIPNEQMLGGLTQISVVRTDPGVIERRSPFQIVVIGELDHRTSTRAERIAEAFRSTGVDARASVRIGVELWQKFIFIAATAAACGLARSPVGPIRDTKLGRRLLARAAEEVIAVGRARGVALPENELARVLDLIDSLPAQMKPSFLLDLEAGGPTELDVLSGAVVRFASELGLDVPVHETAAAALGLVS